MYCPSIWFHFIHNKFEHLLKLVAETHNGFMKICHIFNITLLKKLLDDYNASSAVEGSLLHQEISALGRSICDILNRLYYMAKIQINIGWVVYIQGVMN